MTIPRPAVLVLACTAALAWPVVQFSEPLVDAAPGMARATTNPGDLWLAPEREHVAARQALARAVKDLAAGRAADALPVFSKANTDPVLGGYALLFTGRAHLRLGRASDATETARRLHARSPAGHLEEAGLWLAADAATDASDPAAALVALQRLAGLPGVTGLPAVHLRLGRAAAKVGATELAARAFATIYFDHPLAPEAAEARTELTRVAPAHIRASRDTYPRTFSRAERLYSGKQYADARAAFESAKPFAAEADRDVIDLRLAQCDFYLKRYAATSAALHAYTPRAAARAVEAEFLYISTLRETGRVAEYFARVRPFVERNADPALAERALNDLGTFHVLANEDGKAAEVFADLYRRYPTGAFAERAAWKAGWWAYRTGAFAETARIFESAAVGLRRADFRPAWLYWSARSRMQMGQPQAAIDGYARTIADYRNTYYGRAATRESQRIQAARRPAGAGQVSPASLAVPGPIAVPSPRPENAPLIQGLLAAGMYDEAIAELRRVQAAGGASPLVEATIAFALNRQGKLRPAITSMRRAYPQFMAAGGEALPEEILTVIFPVDHWPLIQQHAAGAQLDRHLLAALIAQESTFQADVKSSANAWGLMQILPPTGRQYAQRLGIRPFATRRLTEPGTNVRIGTTFFADLLKRFGDVGPALAAYNAGGSRVAKWQADRPGLDRDEFIDDIPYPETQNYVKRILGTAEDYRRLYR